MSRRKWEGAEEERDVREKVVLVEGGRCRESIGKVSQFTGLKRYKRANPSRKNASSKEVILQTL